MADQTVTPSEVAAASAVPAAYWSVAVSTVSAIAALAAVTIHDGAVVTATTVAALAAVTAPSIPVRVSSVAATTALDSPRVFSPYDRWRPRHRPDTRHVLLCGTQPGNHDTPTGFAEMTFWMFRANGHERELVLGTPSSVNDGAATPSSLGWVSYGHPEWDPSGDTLVVFVETSTQYRIVVLDGNEFTVVQTLHSVTKPNVCGDPSFSPDGAKVVFTEKIGSTYYISTVTDAATPVYTQLASSSDELFDPYFSPAGDQIVYTKKTSATGTYGSWDLKVMPAAGGAASTVLSNADAHMHPWWVDGSTLLFQTYRYGTDTAFMVAKIDISGAGLEILGTGEYPQTVNI